MEWFSVDEKLPENDDDVFIAYCTIDHDPLQYDVGNYDKESKYWKHKHLCIVRERGFPVTHWCPISIPKVNKKYSLEERVRGLEIALTYFGENLQKLDKQVNPGTIMECYPKWWQFLSKKS